MMLDNSSYNKVKLVHEISALIWFIDKHALLDAEASGDKEFTDLLIGIRKNLENNIERLQKTVCVISQ